MGIKPINFDPMDALTGAEIIPGYQDGAEGRTTTGDIAALAVSGAANQELIRDTIGTALAGGSGITITPNDGGDTITIASSITQYTDEMARDALGTALTAGAGIAITPSDGSDTITIEANRATITLLVTDPNGSALTTGDGKAYYRVPAAFNGWNLVAVAGAVTTASSSGIPTFQIANVTDVQDMLSTKLTIDANETDSSTAAAAAVIDAAHDDVATGDMLRVDCDVAGTGTKGVIVELTFAKP